MRILLGNVGVKYSKNGEFVQFASVMINPNNDIKKQVLSHSIDNDMQNYDFEIEGKPHCYWVDIEADDDGVNTLIDNNYTVEVKK